MYRSTGYIHRKKMGPQNLISLTRWTITWTIMSKNDKGKYISNWERTMVASFSKSSNCRGSMTLLQIALKKNHKQVMAILTLSGKIPWIATTNSCCINTWQSWDFKPTNLKSLIDIRLLIFEVYPCRNFRLRRHWQKLFSLLLTLCDMLGAEIFVDLVISDATALIYHVKQVLMIFQTILCLALNVKKGANFTVINIFLGMHYVYTMLHI